MTQTDFVTDDLYFAGRTRRYHTWPTIQTQTVAEHSGQMDCIYAAIFGDLGGPVDRYIRLQEAGKLGVGDIPFPVKAENPDLKSIVERLERREMDKLKLAQLPPLHPNLIARIKVCDLLEIMQFGMVERLMGNMYAIAIVMRTRQAALKLAATLTRDDYNAVNEFIERADARHEDVLYQMNRRTGAVGYNLKESA